MGAAAIHRLGTALCLAVAAWALGSVVVAWLGRRAVRRRLLGLFRAEPAPKRTAVGLRRRAVLRVWAAPVGALVAAWALIGGVSGFLTGCGVAYAVRRLVARARPAGGVDVRRAERQLPFAVDLLAACLAAGAGPVEAAEVVGESLGGPVGERLALAGAELRLGSEPGVAWGRLAEIPGARALAECLERAARSGAPAAEPVSRLAAALRADRSRQAAVRAQRAAVLVTAPVGLCFLPAFLAVGVAPVVIGMASGLLAGN
ncbi:type II secretion system F family protein [Streptomyces sp. RerS4]|uniref:type II secretion system F family protein n=1 Tax=Streptomyces sp. RerS4 TaxID=2942449 RepID=UPI00201C2FEC|nr:type II secretion system F family protein [Streptomyces sp. RerS4]UQX01742.1 type II secretion system F family protein [Streptomyces sp. RerS4]